MEADTGPRNFALVLIPQRGHMESLLYQIGVYASSLRWP